MDMKLNSQQLKSLRLNKSWSQEILAEKAGLNPRTIQRVEADGSASLHTRKQIALALGVEPATLDLISDTEIMEKISSGYPPHTSSWSKLKNIHLQKIPFHMPLLLLITAIYLAWAPIFFSLSKSNFMWLEFSYLLFSKSTWFLLTLGFCLCISLPCFAYIAHKKRKSLPLYLSFVIIFILSCSFRVVQQALVMNLWSLLLYAGGLLLLANHYRQFTAQQHMRRLLYMSLAIYIVVWLIQGRLSLYLFSVWIRTQQDLATPLPWVSFVDYLMGMLKDSVQLFPLMLVILYDIGNKRFDTSNIQSTGPKSSTSYS